MASCWWNCLLVNVCTQEQAGAVAHISDHVRTLTLDGQMFYSEQRRSFSQALSPDFSPSRASLLSRLLLEQVRITSKLCPNIYCRSGELSLF